MAVLMVGEVMVLAEIMEVVMVVLLTVMVVVTGWW